MRTPEEITRALEFCTCGACPGDDCLYDWEDRAPHPGDCENVLMGDALQLIRQLTTRNETQADTIKQLIAVIGNRLPKPQQKEEQV